MNDSTQIIQTNFITMALHDLYSKRYKKQKGEIPSVFTFDYLPETLRIQIIHIIQDAIGVPQQNYASSGKQIIEQSYEHIHSILCREYGRFVLVDAKLSKKNNVLQFLLRTSEINRALDVIELCFRYITDVIPFDNDENNNYEHFHFVEIKMNAKEAVDELNARFKEHGVGYQFLEDAKRIVRLDSTYVHEEIVKPSLSLLFNKKFDGACDEYLKAFDHYKNKKNKECIAECLKAYESVLKTICKYKAWQVDDKATAKALLTACYDNKLIPDYMQSEFTALRSLLQDGIVPLRNRVAGHGQGQSPVVISDSLARYALNVTGSSIIFLVEQSGL